MTELDTCRQNLDRLTAAANSLEFRSPSSWSTFTPSTIDGLQVNFCHGIITDDRYAYFVPSFIKGTQTLEVHSTFVRFDSRNNGASPSNPSSWAAYNASITSGLRTEGYLGGVRANDRIFFAPGYSPNVLVYNTSLPFASPSSWTAYNISNALSLPTSGFWSASFDGRWVYFAPFTKTTPVVRHDTTRPFTETTSWQAHRPTGYPSDTTLGTVSDGTNVYFIPQALPGFAIVTRFSPSPDFTNPAAWTFFNITANFPSIPRGFAGGAFDGRYIYLAPRNHFKAVRYDTTKLFQSASSWEVSDIQYVGNSADKGTAYATFDGRYVLYRAYSNIVANLVSSTLIRFDTKSPRGFSDYRSWDAVVLAENGILSRATEPVGVATIGTSGVVVSAFLSWTTNPANFDTTFAVWDQGTLRT
jgi:hypothetical protein